DAAQLSAALGRFAAGDDGGVLLGTPGSESRLRPSEPQPVGEAAGAAALEALARRWLAGTEFDWDALYPSRPAPISLPSYPFAREHCWLPGAHVPARQAPPAAAPAPPAPTAYAETADDREAPDAADPSRVEERVLSLLSDLTGYPPAELDPRLSFHAHGLDSLSLIRLADRLNAAYGLSLTPDTFLDATTPAALSAFLCREHGDELRRTAEHGTDRDREPASGPQPPAGPEPSPGRHPAAEREARAAAAPSPSPGSDPVVVVGMAGVMPDSPDLVAFWSNLESGGDLVSEVPADRWDWRAAYGDPSESPDRSRVHRGGFMPGVDGFDPLFFGISPREAAWMDPRQRLLLRTVWSAIEDAGIDPGELAGTRTGLFVGAGAAEYADLIRRSGVPVDAYASTGLTPSMLVNRISY
ncbi:type I polyketide synthase, partial [Streptomyces xiaopingdaonensis]|uniref:type I polyketide synthase n=1 Tax=Streptomyces xiaopingdaonensis TaxID=1565415 RepID=UPI000523F78D